VGLKLIVDLFMAAGEINKDEGDWIHKNLMSLGDPDLAKSYK
jgi:hypothetical protein